MRSLSWLLLRSKYTTVGISKNDIGMGPNRLYEANASFWSKCKSLPWLECIDPYNLFELISRVLKWESHPIKEGIKAFKLFSERSIEEIFSCQVLGRKHERFVLEIETSLICFILMRIIIGPLAFTNTSDTINTFSFVRLWNLLGDTLLNPWIHWASRVLPKLEMQVM